MAKNADVIIIGGGIIGLASARELVSRGFHVTVIDRGEFGQEASFAAAGLLVPHTESTGSAALDTFCIASNDLYPEFVAGLKDETGIDSELRNEGTLLVAINEKDHEEIEERSKHYRATGVEFQSLSREEVLKLEPAINPSVRGGLRIPADRQVDNRKLVGALNRALEIRGIDLRAHATVEEIACDKSGAWRVRTRDGVLETANVVLAAGAWSATLSSACIGQIPVVPVRGQIVCLQAEPGRLIHCIISSNCYLVPRLDGRVLIGSTMEHVGFDKTVTSSGMHGLLEAAFAVAPRLRDSAFREAWAGLRPDTPDHLPIIGAGPAAGLITATGHFRNGILLAPATARVVGQLAAGESPFINVNVEAFHPNRFRESR